jgi:hypothetical protein
MLQPVYETLIDSLFHGKRRKILITPVPRFVPKFVKNGQFRLGIEPISSEKLIAQEEWCLGLRKRCQSHPKNMFVGK